MLPELKVKISADTTGFDGAVKSIAGGFDSMEGRIKQASDKIKDFGQSTQDLGKKMLPVSGIVSGVGAALFGTAISAARAGNEIDKSSKAAGVSAEAYQELGFAVGQISDVSQEQLGTALQAMTRRMGEAADGSKTMIAAFDKIGISVDDITSGAVTTEDAFMRLSEAATEMGTDAEAAAVAADLLGRSGAALGPILRESGGDMADLREQARELGFAMSGDAVQASADFVDKMSELKAQAGGLKNELGVALLPVLTRLANVTQDKIIPAIQGMAEKVGQAIEWFGALPDGVQAAAGIIASAFAVAGPALMAIGGAIKIVGSLAALFSPAGLIIGGLIAVAAAWAKWGDDIKEFTSDAVNLVIEKFTGLMDWFAELPGRLFEIGRNMVQGLLNGFNEMWENFKENIRDKVDWIPDWIKRRMGIASPSKVFHEIGVNLGEGLANGINASFGMVQSAVKGIADMTTSAAFGMASDVVDAMGQMFQGSKPIAAAQALINTFQGITEALKLPFPSSLGAAAKVAAQGFAAVRGIQGTSPGNVNPSGGAGGVETSEPAQVAPSQQTTLTLVGDFFSAQQLADTLNEFARQGGRLDGDLIVRQT